MRENCQNGHKITLVYVADSGNSNINGSSEVDSNIHDDPSQQVFLGILIVALGFRISEAASQILPLIFFRLPPATVKSASHN